MPIPNDKGSVATSSMSMGTAYWIGTAVWIALGAVGYAVAVGMNKVQTTRQLAVTLTITGIICMWLMWSCVYWAQMSPLVAPLLVEGVEE